MNIASRTHDFGKHSISGLPKLLKAHGINAAQIVLHKGFCEISSYEEMKDFIIDKGDTRIPVKLGEGIMNYSTVADWFSRNKPDITVVREELNPLYVKDDLNYIHSLFDKLDKRENLF